MKKVVVFSLIYALLIAFSVKSSTLAAPLSNQPSSCIKKREKEE